MAASQAIAGPVLYVTCAGPAGTSGEGLLDAILPAGSTITLLSNLASPEGLVFDNSGNLDIAIARFNLSTASGIETMAPNGNFSILIDTLQAPLKGLAIGNDGTIYGGQWLFGDGITKIDPLGNASQLCTLQGWTTGLAINASGDIFAESSGITEVTPSGVTSTFATGPSGGGLAFDSHGNLFAADYANDQIDEITPAGQVSVFASGLDEPTGLAFDSSGNLYSADYGDGTIDEISPTGSVSLYASGLSQPEYIAISPVPEPASAALFGATVVVLSSRRKMCRRHEPRPS